jgi:hypothetical protein
MRKAATPIRNGTSNTRETARGGAGQGAAAFHLGGPMESWERAEVSGNLNDREQEGKKIRRLQVMISMVMSVIGQDPNLTLEEASELAAGAKRAALAMFPDKEFAYDILYRPRLQRLMNERFRLQ